jgi:predicted glycoside hydrolase/deacetylase ChbG (UPF0249 family)
MADREAGSVTAGQHRYLIVNADDFGRSHGINRGVVASHEHGIVTSASLMVCWPASRDAAVFARAYPALDVGIHIDLGEWVYVSGSWRPLYERIDPADPRAVYDEMWRQIERFDQLVGVPPSHLDSHQHVHLSGPAQEVALEIGGELGIVVRGRDPEVTYRGDFYGQSGRGDPVPGPITPPGLISLLGSLEEGTTEIGCHPADRDESGSVYAHERDTERETLCDPAVRETLDVLSITLSSFRQSDTTKIGSEAP